MADTRYHALPENSPLSPYSPLSPDPDRKIARASVTSFFNKRSSSSAKYTTKSRPRSLPWHYLAHFLSLLWLVPILILLILNLRGQIIGASAWCPRGHCTSEALSNKQITHAATLDRHDHDINGVLQLVAKALEVWFLFIATALLYDFAMILARREGGLPIGYVLTHLEFSDIRNLFNPMLWTSFRPHTNATPTQRHHKSVVGLTIFALLAAILTILTNLMGPATAVLVLPTLQWVDTPSKVLELYSHDNLGGLPYQFLASDTDTYCNQTLLNAGNYSCAMDIYGPDLDSAAGAAQVNTIQADKANGGYLNALFEETAVTFMLNYSTEDRILWAPNRHVLRNISAMANGLWNAEDPRNDLTSLNDSLQVLLNQQGPIFGAQIACNTGNVTMWQANATTEVLCFTGWTIDLGTNYTKCYRINVDPSHDMNSARFWIGNDGQYTEMQKTAVDVYLAQDTAYFDESSIMPACLTDTSNNNCDWDNLFATPVTDKTLSIFASDVTLVSYSVADSFNDYTSPESDSLDYEGTALPMYNNQSRIYCDNAITQEFSTYVFDTLPSSNPLNLIRTQNYGVAKKIPLHPDWLLAGFTVDRNGTVDSSRTIAQQLSKTLPWAWKDPSFGDAFNSQVFFTLHHYIVGQTLSLADYESFPSSNADDSNDENQFRMWANRHVWAYGINGSRTSKLGLVVVTFGMICVIFRLGLGLWLGKREHSPVELFVAALEHQPAGEFTGMNHESHMAKVRYVMEEDPRGKPRFVPERHYTGAFELE